MARRGSARHVKARFFQRKDIMATKKATDNGVATNRIADLDAPDVMRPEIVTFKITGTSPLLQNNPAAFIGQESEVALGAGKKKYNDDEEAKLRLYLDPEGAFCHPCESFTKAMVKAVAGKKFGKLFATNAIKGAVFIAEPFALILDEHGKPAKHYSIDRRPVIVGKARVLRCRPCWMKWRMNVALEIDMAILNRDLVKQSLSLAGRIIGIGDYRPEKGGGFGRFTVE